MRAQALNVPKKSPKILITNQVDLVFTNSLCTSIARTLYCDSLSRLGTIPNPDREITMRAQALNVPKKSPKSLITNLLDLVFTNSLCTAIACTLYRDSLSGFGKIITNR